VQPRENTETEIPSYAIDIIGGGGQNRTVDLRVMSRSRPIDSKQDQQLSSAEHGKSRRNPLPPRYENGDK
jgi:hypothetical protein